MEYDSFENPRSVVFEDIPEVVLAYRAISQVEGDDYVLSEICRDEVMRVMVEPDREKQSWEVPQLIAGMVLRDVVQVADSEADSWERAQARHMLTSALVSQSVG